MEEGPLEKELCQEKEWVDARSTITNRHWLQETLVQYMGEDAEDCPVEMEGE